MTDDVTPAPTTVAVVANALFLRKSLLCIYFGNNHVEEKHLYSKTDDTACHVEKCIILNGKSTLLNMGADVNAQKVLYENEVIPGRATSTTGGFISKLYVSGPSFSVEFIASSQVTLFPV